MFRFVPLLALALVGCGGAHGWEGVWLLQTPYQPPTDPCLPDVSENFSDAEPIELEEVDSPWEIEEEHIESDSAMFLQVLVGKRQDVFVVIGGTVYPGKADGKTLEVSWTNADDSFYSEDHEEGYYFEESEVTTVKTTIKINRGKGGAATGTVKTDTEFEGDYRETDRWKPADVGVTNTQLKAQQYIDGDEPVNTPNAEECEDEECEYSVTLSCSTESKGLKATFAGDSQNGQYDGIDDATQAGGI